MSELFAGKPEPGREAPVFNFVDDGGRMLDFTVATKPGGIARAYVATPIIGACTVCKLSGSLDLPVDFDYKTGDKIMAGRIVKAFCPQCRRTTEFRPMTPGELHEDQFYIMRRYYELYKKFVTDGRAIPFEMQQFVDAFEKKMREVQRALGLKPAFGESPEKETPTEPDAPRIIVPS